MHVRDMFPPKCMPVFLSFVMGIARNICRCRSIEGELTRQAVGKNGTDALKSLKLLWFILAEGLTWR